MPTKAAFLVLALAIMVLIALSPLASAASNQGFVAYRLTISGQDTTSNSVLVNETVQPTSRSDFSIISLAVSGSSTNFSISKDLNTSSFLELFPFLPAVSNESFTYSRNGYTVNVNFANSGAVPINFRGASYTANNYSLMATVTNSTGSSTFHGTLLTTPSGLLYSAEILSARGVSFAAQLVGTSLPLTDTSGASQVEGATIVGIGVVGAAALAVPFWKFGRKRSPEKKVSEEKPSYWVD